MPERMKDLVRSKKTFAGGTLVEPMSYGVSPTLRSYIEYRLLTIFETAINVVTTQMNVQQLPIPAESATDAKWLTNKNQCLDGFRGDLRPAVDFGLETFGPIFHNLALVLLASLNVLIIELIWRRIAQRKKVMPRAIVRQRKRQRMISTAGATVQEPEVELEQRSHVSTQTQSTSMYSRRGYAHA